MKKPVYSINCKFLAKKNVDLMNIIKKTEQGKIKHVTKKMDLKEPYKL